MFNVEKEIALEHDIYDKFRGNAIQIKKITDSDRSKNDESLQNDLSLPPNKFLVFCKEGITESCNQCNYGVIQMNHLKELDIFIVRSQEHVCSLCNQRFLTEDDLQQHGCGFYRKGISNYNLQNVRNTDIINYHLDCIRKAQQKQKFLRKFSCSFCDFGSDHLWNYKRHIMKHGDELPFKCSFCKYATCIKINLDTHVIRNHTKEKMYKCNMCSYKNAVAGRMKEHMYLKHNKWSEDMTVREKKFKCSQCSYQSDYPGNLKRHENTCRLSSDGSN